MTGSYYKEKFNELVKLGKATNDLASNIQEKLPLTGIVLSMFCLVVKHAFATKKQQIKDPDRKTFNDLLKTPPKDEDYKKATNTLLETLTIRNNNLKTLFQVNSRKAIEKISLSTENTKELTNLAKKHELHNIAKIIR